VVLICDAETAELKLLRDNLLSTTKIVSLEENQEKMVSIKSDLAVPYQATPLVMPARTLIIKRK